MNKPSEIASTYYGKTPPEGTVYFTAFGANPHMAMLSALANSEGRSSSEKINCIGVCVDPDSGNYLAVVGVIDDE